MVGCSNLLADLGIQRRVVNQSRLRNLDLNRPRYREDARRVVQHALWNGRLKNSYRRPGENHTADQLPRDLSSTKELAGGRLISRPARRQAGTTSSIETPTRTLRRNKSINTTIRPLSPAESTVAIRPSNGPSRIRTFSPGW